MNFTLNDENTDFWNAVRCLKDGKVLLYPSDTIWGLGCSTDFPEALDRLYEIKQRPGSKAAILLVDSIDMLKKYIDYIHPRVETLMGFHKRPLTVIYKHAKNLDPRFTAQDGSIAIRVCEDLFCKALIQEIKGPLVSTSANFNGIDAPAHFGEIDPLLIQQVGYVVKYRQDDTSKNQVSSIIRFDPEGELEFIRM